MARYRTRIKEHIFMASAHQERGNKPPVSFKQISLETGIPYNTVRRYANTDQKNPNYAIVDTIRKYLNGFLPEDERLGDSGYISEVESGQFVAVA